MADTGAIFGGEHSAHYYFRDFWGADSGMLAALHVLAALGEQRPAAVGVDGRLPALRSLRRDQLHRHRRADVRRGGAEVVRRPHPLDRPPRRGDRRSGRRQLVQPADLQHRAAAAAQRRGPHRRRRRRRGRAGGRRNRLAAPRHRHERAARHDRLRRRRGPARRRPGRAAARGLDGRCAGARHRRGARRGRTGVGCGRPAAAHGDLGRRPRQRRDGRVDSGGGAGRFGRRADRRRRPKRHRGSARWTFWSSRATIPATRHWSARRRPRCAAAPGWSWSRRTKGRCATPPRGARPCSSRDCGFPTTSAWPATWPRAWRFCMWSTRACAWISPRSPTNSTPRRCATAPARELFTNPAKTLADRMSGRTVVLAGDNAATLALARHGGAIMLRIAHQAVAAVGLADAHRGAAQRDWAAQSDADREAAAVPRRRDRRAAAGARPHLRADTAMPSAPVVAARVAGLDDVDVVGAEDVPDVAATSPVRSRASGTATGDAGRTVGDGGHLPATGSRIGE